MSDISLSNTNDIIVSTNNSPTAVQITGSADLISAAHNKLQLTIDRAKAHDDQGNQ